MEKYGRREKVRPVGLSVAAMEPHFIAGAAVEALFTVYDNLASSIKPGSRVAKALPIFGVINLPQSAVTSPGICATAAAEGPRQTLLTDHIHHRIQHSPISAVTYPATLVAQNSKSVHVDGSDGR